MRLSKTALGLLNNQYRSVLKKCFLINAGLFALAMPAKAAVTEVTEAYLNALTPNVSWTLNPNGEMEIGSQRFNYMYTPSSDTNQHKEFIGHVTDDISRGAAKWVFLGHYSEPQHISGDFIDNYVQGTNVSSSGSWNDYYGGAVFISQVEDGNGTGTDTVNGNFIGNYVVSTNETPNTQIDNYAAFGGGLFIYNRASDISYVKSTIDVTANFIGNYVSTQNVDARGGALAVTGTVGDVIGDFVGNHVSSSSASGLGGALYIDTVGEPSQSNAVASIERISGKFLDNYAVSIFSRGGAIYNNATIGTISDSTFSGNASKGYAANTAFGGAIYNDTNGDINSISGTFTGNYSGYYGGAIANNGMIGSIRGDFVGNYSGYSGAAIYNTGTIDTIDGNFGGNGIAIDEGDLFDSQGGVIWNSGTIDELAGSFNGNRMAPETGVNIGGIDGGVIYNSGEISALNSDFVDNYVDKGSSTSFGGLIYNIGTIESMTGDFMGNEIVSVYANHSSTTGGLIYNNHIIGEISGDFINNQVGLSEGAMIHNDVSGVIDTISGSFSKNILSTRVFGSIVNNGEITSITGDFTENSGNFDETSYGYGIINTGHIKNIASNFTKNVFEGENEDGSGIYMVGAAITNYGGVIDTISGDFSGNKLTATGANKEVVAYGPLFTISPIGSINGSFTDNAAIASGPEDITRAAGAAVYNEGVDLTFLADGKTNTFKGNYIQINSGEKQYEAIYSNGGSLTFDTKNGGKFAFSDYINGEADYEISLVGDGTGTFGLYDNVFRNAADVDLNSITFDLKNSNVYDYDFSAYNTPLSVGADVSLALDINVSQQKADKITALPLRDGVFNVTDVNLLDVSDAFQGKAQVLNVVDNDDYTLKLTLDDALVTKYAQGIYQRTESGFDDLSSADVSWNGQYGAYTDDIALAVNLSLAQTKTPDDSIAYDSQLVHNKTYATGANLSALNQTDQYEDKNFNFDTAEDDFHSVADLGTTSGNVNVNGVDDGQGNKSTVDLDGNQGFDIADGTSVTLNDVDLVNSDEEKSVTEVDKGGSFNVNDSNIGDNVEIVNNGDVNLGGENKIGSDVTGDGKINVNGGETTFTDSTIDNDIDIDEGATVRLEGDNKIGGDVNGKGDLDNQGNTTLVDSTVGEGVKVNNDGTINLEGNSKINGQVTGDGTTNINGYVSVSDDISGKVNVNNGGTLDIDNNKVKGNDITFAEGSTFAVTVNSKDDYGTLTADKITVKDGAVLSATLGQGIVGAGEEATVQLLKANNKDFNNFADRFDNNMYKFEKDGKDGAYKISLVKTAEDISKDAGGSKTNQGAAAAWVDGSKFVEGSVAAAVADQLAALAQNDAKAFNEALTDLAPAEAPMVQENVVALTSRLHHYINQQLLNGSTFGNRYQGRASGDALEDVSVWGDVYMGKTKLDKRGQFYGFDTDSKGLVIGADKKLTSDVKLGAGYMYDDSDIDGHNRKTDVNTNTIFGYGEYKPSEWFVNGVVSYGRSTYKEKKHVLGNSYKGKYHADTYGLQGLTGYEMATEHVDLTPQAGLRYNHIKRHGYVDGLGQNIGGKNLDILTAVAGVKVSKDMYGLACKWIRPEAYLGITYDLKSNRDNAVVKLGNGASYAVHGKRLARFGIEAGAGLTAELTDRLSANINYLGAFRDDYKDHTGMIGLKYNF